VWVPGGRDDTCRFVEQQVREALGCDRAAVYLDRVGRTDERVQPTGLAVHEHTTGLDQLVRAAPGRDPGAREVGVEAHDRMLPCCRTGAKSAQTRAFFAGTLDRGWRVDTLQLPTP
jgi:hypothetical protein